MAKNGAKGAGRIEQVMQQDKIPAPSDHGWTERHPGESAFPGRRKTDLSSRSKRRRIINRASGASDGEHHDTKPRR